DPPIVTRLPHDVRRGENVDVQAAIRTPEQPGKYVLLVELFSRDFDWFSQTGLYPAMLKVDVQPSVNRQTGQTDVSDLYSRPSARAAQAGKPWRESLTASVPRSSLWRAAILM